MSNDAVSAGLPGGDAPTKVVNVLKTEGNELLACAGASASGFAVHVNGLLLVKASGTLGKIGIVDVDVLGFGQGALGYFLWGAHIQHNAGVAGDVLFELSGIEVLEALFLCGAGYEAEGEDAEEETEEVAHGCCLLGRRYDGCGF